MDNTTPSRYSDTGYLIVKVSEANRAIPLQGALVTVKGADRENSGVIIALRTDSDGRTERAALPAPASEASMQPGNGRPYASYNIEIDLEGFYSQSNLNVPIFSGITALQGADLIPYPQDENLYPGGDTRFFESENAYLEEDTNDT